MRRYIILIIVILMAFNLFGNTSYSLKNAGLSLLLPGTGLHSTGNTKAGFVFNGIEMAAVLSSGMFYFSSINTDNNAIDFASVTLNEPVHTFPEHILSKMEIYYSSDYYNSLLPSKARDLYPDDVDKQNEYINANTIADSLAWTWQYQDDIDDYYTMRKLSRAYYQYFIYAASSVVLNHLVSGIFTFFDVEKRFNVELDNAVGYSDGKRFIFNIGLRF